MGSKVNGEKKRKFYVSLVIKYQVIHLKTETLSLVEKMHSFDVFSRKQSILLSSNLFIKNRLLQDDRYEQNVMPCTFCIAVKLCSFFLLQDPTVF